MRELQQQIAENHSIYLQYTYNLWVQYTLFTWKWWLLLFVLVDTSVLPITYMLIYQYNSKWSSFLIAIVIMSAFFSFIAEPFLVWLGIYELITWKHYYSFPLYILYGVILKFIVDLTKSIQSKNSS
ncbi:hypothetical protein SPACI_048760 [Sporomusa acidovorans DSM 3132]|uniref:Uncharacterized protein n=1 Tax=Sporomusa acidovorans (strain ATCC 49682 / DSM 3132 / Mol) TaxID=1123286 RepID=A0ABZ3J908_SPOA4|nr:hypothetical protein SPACI_45220 [Sporomusa acidovorans DSM 3132]SDE29386.1 hypothetical protein SAMN04488499_101120 [Sporomusa acidovorans]